MFDEIDNNNNCKNKVSLKKSFYDDNKVDSIVPIENEQIILKIEEKFKESELIRLDTSRLITDIKRKRPQFYEY